jgi:hypothetical protein
VAPHANTVFFNFVQMVEGEKRGSANEAETITDQNELKTHMVDFVKHLFGSSSQIGLHLSSAFWAGKQLDEGDKKLLLEPFTEREVAEAIGG